MSVHWRLAIWGAIWVSTGAVLVGAVIWFLYGEAYAGAFLYGVSVGIVSFVSTAMTVSLLTGRSTAVGMLVGIASFAARLGFAAVALGVPAYLGLWPVGAALGGFAGVYLAENVMLLPRVLMTKPSAKGSVRKEIKRRVEA